MTVERRDFLVELGTEELPPTALRGLEQAFAAGIRTGLQKAGLTHGDVVSFAEPVPRICERRRAQECVGKGR